MAKFSTGEKLFSKSLTPEKTDKEIENDNFFNFINYDKLIKCINKTYEVGNINGFIVTENGILFVMSKILLGIKTKSASYFFAFPNE